jgi:uncharacterized membrane protein (DUF2068 family)
MTDSPSQSLSRPKRHNRWLVLISVFKLAQAALFVTIGVGALRLVHKDLGDLLLRLAHHLHFGPESRFVDFVLDRASIVTDRLLRRFSLAVFCYAALGLAEGIGLYLEKAWGEYLTLGITASFLPWEIFEVMRKLTWIRSSLLLINALVFIYLLKLVAERQRSKKESLAVGE